MRKIIFRISYVVVIVLFLVSFFVLKKLPQKSEIVPDLYREPIQTETTRKDFSFSYRHKNYNVRPIADYELWGLVVSKNNINAWYNYYTDKNSVNLKDVCVVWGKNIEDEVYRDKAVSFSSGEWTCYINFSEYPKETFYEDKLSNNHLLTADPAIQDKIRNLNIGDQIYLKGSLVDYAEERSSWYRMTSVSREDINSNSRSGGACEIVYVDEIKIFKKYHEFWHFLNQAIKIVFTGLVITNITLFFIDTKKFVVEMETVEEENNIQ